MRSNDYPNTRDYHQPIASNAVNPAIDPKRRYLCRHIFTDGHRCGSPSLRGRDLCYYHVRARRDAPCATRGGTFVMSRIEDRPSVQLAIYDVLSRVASGDIEYRRGSVLLYGLQIASSNLARQEKLLADRPQQVEEVTSDYDLGDLAPIVEITDANATATAETAPDASAVSDASTVTNTATMSDEAAPATAAAPHEAVILNGVKDPCISPAAPTAAATSDEAAPATAATPHEAVILNGVGPCIFARRPNRNRRANCR